MDIGKHHESKYTSHNKLILYKAEFIEIWKVREGFKKREKIVEFSTNPLVKKKRKMIYMPWKKFCMILVLWHLSDGLSTEL